MFDFFSLFFEKFHLPLSNPVLIFSIILIIILLSPILFRRIGVPGIIVLIISGVIVGPHGLNLLGNNAAVELFSTIGMLYIIFIAGLDLDLNQFKVYKYKSILFGFLTFTIPLFVGFPVAYYFFNYDFNASLLIASMFSTHTLVAYPIVSKLGITKNEAVAVTVGGTIITDTAVLIMLAIIMGRQSGMIEPYFWLKLFASMLVFFFFMFYFVPKIAKWFFSKLESEKHSHYIFVLAVVFLAAFMAELAGLEPIIGAFVAGLVLNRLIPQSSALMNRIEFIGNSLFIPFFLISVGMIVDISILFHSHAAFVIVLTLSIVALTGKWLAAYFTQKILHYTRSQRLLIFGLSSSRAAAILAVILVGYEAGIIDINILNGTIILILISCIVASFVTEFASKKIVIADSSEDINKAHLHKDIVEEHILIPIANMSNINILLEFGMYIKNKKSRNSISILSCVPNDENAENNIFKTKNKLEQYIKEASASEQLVNIIVSIDHNPSSGIARTAKEILADIIIVGWPKKKGMLEILIGNKVENLINNTDKTIFICQLIKPFIYQKRIIIFIPPLAEKEDGFILWFSKIINLTLELSLPIVLYSNNDTLININKIQNTLFNSVKIYYEIVENWDELLFAKDIRKDDLIVLASARKGAVSYFNLLEEIPEKLEKYFQDNNKILIYPHRFSHHYKVHGYEGFTMNNLDKGMSSLKKIRKGFRKFMK